MQNVLIRYGSLQEEGWLTWRMLVLVTGILEKSVGGSREEEPGPVSMFQRELQGERSKYREK